MHHRLSSISFLQKEVTRCSAFAITAVMTKCDQLAFGWAAEIPSRAALATQDSEAIATLARELSELCPPAAPVLDDSPPLTEPLVEAIQSDRFGKSEYGLARPTPAEIHVLTEALADLLINLIEGFRQMEAWLVDPQCSDSARLYHERDVILLKYLHVVAVYCRDFGRGAADCLEAYARQRARSVGTSRECGNTS